MATNKQFGDLFSYEYSYETMGFRRFYNCVMLKDAYVVSTGTRLTEVYIEPPNHIWFGTTERFYYPMKNMSIKLIQSEVFDMYIKDLTLTHFDITRGLEDKYGTHLDIRTCIFIEQYMFVLREEFERSVRVIKHHWKRVVSNPSYLMCRRRLVREFESL
jgi:hypothetical protein